jgi:hypothetical protein
MKKRKKQGKTCAFLIHVEQLIVKNTTHDDKQYTTNFEKAIFEDLRKILKMQA